MPRLALAQVEAAREAARRAAHPSKATFALGFLKGQEMDWLPEAMRILRDELPNIEVTVSSQYSPALAEALGQGQPGFGFSAGGAAQAGSCVTESLRPSPWSRCCRVTTGWRRVRR